MIVTIESQTNPNHILRDLLPLSLIQYGCRVVLQFKGSLTLLHSEVLPGNIPNDSCHHISSAGLHCSLS